MHSADAEELTTLDERPAPGVRQPGEAFFRALVDSTVDVILIVDVENVIRYASPSASRLFGTPSVTGTAMGALVHPDDRASATRILRGARRGQQHTRGGDWRVVQADGGIRRVEVTCLDLLHDPAVNGVVATLRDVTQQRRLERELTHQALHDPLTGLPNRRTFMKRVQQAVARSRDRTGPAVAVLIVDLDDFRVVNETLGHEAGDELLVAVGERIADTVVPAATVARLGGDEFAVLIAQVDHPVDVDRVAEHVLAAFAEPFTSRRIALTCRASVGVATTADASDGDELLRQADLALHAAKNAGKGRWSRYEPALHAEILDRLRIRTDLDKAIARGELTLRFQPIVQLDSGKTMGFEALLRWRHPTRGMLSPPQFIDVAEDSGLIVPIGDRVLQLAIAAAVRWRAVTPRPTSVSVNVSARQFRSPGFVDRVHRELAVAGLPPECLVLEITESLLLRDDDQVWSDLSRLRERGIRVAIDDFGTGYSALSYLRQVPIDIVKLDRSFIRTIETSPQQHALVDGIVRLAHTLGLRVVAEGVERREEGTALVKMGCQFAQGFFFARPMTAADATRWLRNGAPDRARAVGRRIGAQADAALCPSLPITVSSAPRPR